MNREQQCQRSVEVIADIAANMRLFKNLRRQWVKLMGGSVPPELHSRICSCYQCIADEQTRLREILGLSENEWAGVFQAVLTVYTSSR
jgi:hypothetical protein